MSIDLIRTIVPGQGELVRPDWGDDASENWAESEWRAFGSEEEGCFGGAWEGEPGTLRCDPYPYDEVCVMFNGRVALIDLDGRRREFGAGDAFFVPRHFQGTWETIEPSRKVFVALPELSGEAGAAESGEKR